MARVEGLTACARNQRVEPPGVVRSRNVERQDQAQRRPRQTKPAAVGIEAKAIRKLRLPCSRGASFPRTTSQYAFAKAGSPLTLLTPWVKPTARWLRSRRCRPSFPTVPGYGDGWRQPTRARCRLCPPSGTRPEEKTNAAMPPTPVAVHDRRVSQENESRRV